MLKKEAACNRLPKWEPQVIEKLQQSSGFAEMHIEKRLRKSKEILCSLINLQ